MGVLWIRDTALGDEVTDGHEGVEALGDRPRQTFSLGLVLYVSRRHVDGEDVACGAKVNSLTFVYAIAFILPLMASIAPLVSSG